MGSLRRNVVANLFGRAWMAIMSLAFVPLYVRELGVESYALVGFYAAMAAVLGLLDLGLAATIDREIARMPTDPGPEAVRATRSLLRTFEAVFLGVGLAIGVALLGAAPWLATDWLNRESLPVEVATNAIRVMGLIFALQWPLGIYTGALVGLQRQVENNVLNIVFSTMKFGGAAVVVMFVSARIEVFFAWQLATTLTQTVLTRWMLFRRFPHPEVQGAIDLRVLTANWRFSVGMSALTILGVLMNQVDRLVVSRYLSLEDLGYYSIANSVSRSLVYLVMPVFTAFYPKLCQLIAAGDTEGTRDVYRTGSQVLAVAVAPAGCVIAVFAHQVVLAWTGDPVVAGRTDLAVMLIAIGATVNGLMHMPFGLQVAHGWTSFAVALSALTLVLMGPLLAYVATHHGLVGVGAAWSAVIASSAILTVDFVHKRLLPSERWLWFRDGFIIPLAVASAVTLAARACWPDGLGRVGTAMGLVVVSLVVSALTALATPLVRARLRSALETRSAGLARSTSD